MIAAEPNQFELFLEDLKAAYNANPAAVYCLIAAAGLVIAWACGAFRRRKA